MTLIISNIMKPIAYKLENDVGMANAIKSGNAINDHLEPAYYEALKRL